MKTGLDLKAEILDIPRALRETLEKGRPEYDALVRRTRWGDGPIYIVGSGPPLVAGLTAAYAFESLLGWPALVREAAVFQAYAAPGLRPRSVLLAISGSGEESELMEVAEVARARGATVLVLASNTQSRLAQMADGVFLVRAGEESGAGAKLAVCQQAAASYLGLVAARALKRQQPSLAAMEADFEKLPAHVEWVLTQLRDAAQSFAAELRGWRSLSAVGGGFYHPAALEWAWRVRKLTGIDARGFEVAEFLHGPLASLEREATVVVISGSRCRAKKHINQLVARLKKVKLRVFSVTDGNDPEVSRHSELAVLLPLLSEAAGATLALALLDWVAYQAARGQDADARPASLRG
jgi:glucosamine--fructose-6-phosphate aminotransferase (isomerizing)